MGTKFLFFAPVAITFSFLYSATEMNFVIYLPVYLLPLYFFFLFDPGVNNVSALIAKLRHGFFHDIHIISNVIIFHFIV